MRSFWLSYLLCVAYYVIAACLWVLFRFVGLSSVPAFATLDHDSIDHVMLFRRAIIVGCVLGTAFFFIGRGLDTSAIRRRPYGMLILLHALSNIMSVTAVLIGLTILNSMMESDSSITSALSSRVLSINFIVLLIYYSIVSFGFAIIKEVNRKFGPGNLRKLVLGTFYHPREIETIVMFLDLKDSTTYAEQLGHVKFGNLIQDCFFDMTVVVDYEAQFYQYVGDESILLWDVPAGIHNANCLQAFFAYSRRLEEKRDYYESRYGLMPSFKAGVNLGRVTVMEVGEIKREISYLGDVLNTAARIQGLCNTQGEKLIISEALKERLTFLPTDIQIELIGSFELRGRDASVDLYGAREVSAPHPSS